MKLYGSGFQSSIPKTSEVFIKFGTISSQLMDKSEVKDFTWKEDDFYAELNLPKSKLVNAEMNDVKMTDE